MAKPTSRILAVLELLQTYGQLSGTELSSRLGLNRRTLRRYIVALEELGIPIMTERGRYGGYTLMPGFKLQPMMFDENEAMALSMGLLAAKHSGLVHTTPAIASAQAKLERVMPIALKQKMRAIAETVTLDMLPLRKTLEDKNNFLLSLTTAASNQQQITMQYKTANDVTSEREVNPYGLAFYLGYWYIVGFCQVRQDVRTFRVDRIVQLAPLTVSFERPKEFNVLNHLRHSIAMLPRKFSVKVLLYTDLQTAHANIDHTIGLLVQVENGVILHHECSELAWFARQLAFWPFEFKVYHPSQLHIEVKHIAVRLLKSLN
jgi:predicted DNA-binding transcriptional regulator YafY